MRNNLLNEGKRYLHSGPLKMKPAIPCLHASEMVMMEGWVKVIWLILMTVFVEFSKSSDHKMRSYISICVKLTTLYALVFAHFKQNINRLKKYHPKGIIKLAWLSWPMIDSKKDMEIIWVLMALDMSNKHFWAFSKGKQIVKLWKSTNQDRIAFLSSKNPSV